MMKQLDWGMGTSYYRSNMAANSSGFILGSFNDLSLISSIQVIFKFDQYGWQYFLRCDLISIVFTLFIVEYRVISVEAITSIVFLTLREVSSLFLLSIICTESSSTSSAAILKVSSQWLVSEKNLPIWLANWRHVISRQANFSTHEGACSWNRLVQQICPWSLLPHIKPVWYERAKLGSKSFVAQHMFR